MAIRYFCDGCDKEVQFTSVKDVTVRVEFGDTTTGHGGQYELCKSCADLLVRDCDPKKWVRCLPERAVA